MQLQMEHRSAAFFFIGTIGSNGTNRQMVYAQPSGVNKCSLQIVYQSTTVTTFPMESIRTNGTNRQIAYARLSSSNEMQFTNGIPMD